MIYLQAAQGGGMAQIIFFVSMGLILYFFFFRPQMKRQKEQTTFSQEMQKGDEVVTGSGLVGKVNKIDPLTVQLQLDQKTFVTVLRGAISSEMTANYLKSKKEGQS